MEAIEEATGVALAREVLARHEREGRAFVAGPDGLFVHGGPVEPWCYSDDHGDGMGEWPCDAVKLARVILGDPMAGGSDEPDPA
jgi:hypothetical protein